MFDVKVSFIIVSHVGCQELFLIVLTYWMSTDLKFVSDTGCINSPFGPRGRDPNARSRFVCVCRSAYVLFEVP